jgi:hypothetical protein
MAYNKEWFYGRGGDEEPKRKDLRNCILILAIVGVILGLLAGCAAGAPKATSDVPVYVHDSDALRARLLSTPCNDPRVMQMVEVGMPSHADRFKVIEAKFKMVSGGWRGYSGCWAEFTAQEVGFEALFLLFEDGDKYLVNKAEFLAGKGQGT